MNLLFDNLEINDLKFVGITAFSFLFGFCLNNYFLSNSVNKNNFLCFDLKKNFAEKHTTECYYKYKFNCTDSKFNLSDLSILKKIKNDSDFKYNWDIIDMDDVISKIKFTHLNEVSETCANNWSFYIFLRLLSFYPEVINLFSDNIVTHISIKSLLNTLNKLGDFTNNPIIEHNNFNVFTKFVLSELTDDSVNFLISVLTDFNKK